MCVTKMQVMFEREREQTSLHLEKFVIIERQRDRKENTWKSSVEWKWKGERTQKENPPGHVISVIPIKRWSPLLSLKGTKLINIFRERNGKTAKEMNFLWMFPWKCPSVSVPCFPSRYVDMSLFTTQTNVSGGDTSIDCYGISLLSPNPLSLPLLVFVVFSNIDR